MKFQAVGIKMITCNDFVNSYIEFLAEGFDCSSDGPFIVLKSPFLYMDGDYINLYVEQINEQIILSDMGETFRRLREFSFNWRSKYIRSLFANVLINTDTSCKEGKIYTKVANKEEIGENINNLIHAIQQTDNLSITTHYYSQPDFRSDVEMYLRDSGFEPELNYQIAGDSGVIWRIHFFFNHHKNVLAKAISSNSNGGARSLINQTYTAYSDIKIIHPEVVRTLIIDDTKDIWEPEILSLANQVLEREIGVWSKKEDYISSLRELVS